MPERRNGGGGGEISRSSVRLIALSVAWGGRALVARSWSTCMNSVLCRIAVLAGVSCSGIAAGQVSEVWVARYNGPAQGRDQAQGIAVDAQGNVYVTGQSRGGGAIDDGVTIKYDSLGHEVWTRRYNRTGTGNSVLLAVGVSAEGQVYVTGASYDSGGIGMASTIKYASDGTLEWVRERSGSARVLLVDDLGFIYIGGSIDTGGTSPGRDYLTAKYDPDGNELWARTYTGPTTTNSYDDVNALAVDSHGNVYVTGGSYGLGGNTDIATIKYDSAGNTAWIRRYDGPGNGTDSGRSLVVDGEGNVYVTGRVFVGGAGTRQDIGTIKYASDGTQLWVRHYSGGAPSGSVSNAAAGIALAPGSGVYVAGFSATGTSVTTYDIATLRYDADGNELWARRYNGPVDGQDQPHGLATDAAGNVYITGSTAMGAAGGNADFVALKYDPAGNQVWTVRWAGPAGYNDEGFAIAVDAAASVYITGRIDFSSGVSGSGDIGTIKYTQAPVCYANCDQSSVQPILNVDDFTCFINSYAAASVLPQAQQVGHYANCDGSTAAPALNVDDFTCFINRFATGCR
jgi:hypothetical protein